MVLVLLRLLTGKFIQDIHTYVQTSPLNIYPQIYSVALKANMSETEENKEFIKVKIIIIIIQGNLY